MIQLDLEPPRERQRDRWATKSRQQYARQRREKLVLELSRRDVTASGSPTVPPTGYGRCAHCQRNLSPDFLEIDHVDGCAWDKRAVNAWRRVARYWREFAEGVRLRVLCRSCNGSDGHRFRIKTRA